MINYHSVYGMHEVWPPHLVSGHSPRIKRVFTRPILGPVGN